MNSMCGMDSWRFALSMEGASAKSIRDSSNGGHLIQSSDGFGHDIQNADRLSLG